MAGSHASTVRSLYKHILLLHRRLPLDMKAVGDEYVKAEFRRHKTANEEEVKKFMDEWQNYVAVLQDQLQHSDASKPSVGQHLPEEKLDSLSDEQLGQLYELQKETAKPNPFTPPEGSL
ncbi:succinate dehydrogenase assembly factor 3, mitochondrial-like [Acanthaster planci]|uniref:Succinate dehydrogenase assembly factor 3 n=1 Tax=Acanthaster planci TaxID=133434 RepID=A0A8B7Y5T6_ACAPL|nr:succinate dehydrogenase assembly factor 3, mitochondrial-like [Acanthaster planci]XP_022088559.1 succinate dehydrogenase assembly factor 3, mitochondrial-like [Acanthaster planci]XP_022088560.1 succinate dehydrogenase assembly factor 3, mitochondrial-like [Acanthaster planci]